MPKLSTAAALLLLLFAAACAPNVPPAAVEEASIPTLTPEPLEELLTPLPSETQEPAAASTPAPSATAVAPTATRLPTATATPTSVVFDRSGYRQFVVMRSNFPGYLNDLDGPGKTVIRHALSRDGSRLAISGCVGQTDNFWNCESDDSGLLVVLDTENGELVAEIPVGNGWPGGVAFTADGKSLLYATTAQKVALWNLEKNEPGITLLEQPRSGRLSYPAVAASPDGSSYAAVIEKTLYVWDASGSLLLQTPASLIVVAYGALRYSEDGSRLVVFSPDWTGVDVYHTADWSLARRFEMEQIIDAAISPDGRVLAGIEMEEDRGVVWNVETGEQIAELNLDHQASYVRFNPAGDLLVIAGRGYPDTRDSYSIIGSVYETQSWTQLDVLYSFSNPGQVEFSSDGSRMAVFDGALTSIWTAPDAQLLAGFETLQQFQRALHAGDYAAAAELFMVTELERDYLIERGVDVNDLAGSFERMCTTKSMFCDPVQELVMMGYYWETLTYLVRLTGPDGTAVTNSRGEQIIYFYLSPDADGNPRLTYLPKN